MELKMYLNIVHENMLCMLKNVEQLNGVNKFHELKESLA